MEEPVTEGDEYVKHRQLSVINAVTPIISHSDSTPVTPFTLPNGWLIHLVPRPDGPRVDRYFIEPGTGRKFRSRNEVQRYLNNEECKPTKSNPKPLTLEYSNEKAMGRKRMITSGGNMAPESNWMTAEFTLPEDWYVEKVPRKNGAQFDTYYHDPVTGRKFRSLNDVKRYLLEGCTFTRSKRTRRLKYHPNHLQSCESQTKIVSGGKMLDFEEDNDNQHQLVSSTPTSFTSRSQFSLPDGWIMEEVPRKEKPRHIDRYFYEPGTGKKFKSMRAVQRHLAKLELRENKLPLSKTFNLASSSKNHGSYDSRKKCFPQKDHDSSFSNPPSKINWVIGSSSGEDWNAFADDTLVPDPKKQQWSNRFKLKINDSNHYTPISW